MKKIKLATFAKLNDVTPRTIWNWIYKGIVNHHQAEDLAACGLFHNWGID